MKRKILLLTLVLALTASSLFALSGRQIMEKNDNLKEAQSSKSYAVLLIFKGGCQSAKCATRKEFKMASRKFGDTTKTRISFVKPTQIQFLTWSIPGKDSRQWIKRSRGSVRKIASEDKGNSFVNSHFYYEDLSDRNINDYSYRNLGTATVDGEACYKVESRKKTGTQVYSKSIVYVRQKDYVIKKIDLYENGIHSKSVLNQKIQKISGIYTPKKVKMYRTDGKGMSILYLPRVNHNASVSQVRLNPGNL